jgi:hypothetical protein
MPRGEAVHSTSVLSSSIKDFRYIASIPHKDRELFGNCSLHFINYKATFSFLTQVRIIFHQGKKRFLPGWKMRMSLRRCKKAGFIMNKSCYVFYEKPLIGLIDCLFRTL